MRELFIGIFISLLFFGYGICGVGKFAKRMSLIESIIVFITTLVVCLIFKRPDVLEITIMFFIALSVLIDVVVENIKHKNSHWI